MHNRLSSSVSELPSTLRLLCVTANGNSGWLSQSLAADTAMDAEICSATLDSAMRYLREELFDLVVLVECPRLDSLEAMSPLRTTAPDNLAIVVIGDDTPDSAWADNIQARGALCIDACSDDFVERTGTPVRTLLWKLARAAERQALIGQCQQQKQQEANSQNEDYQAAIHQLRSQRSLLLEYLPEAEHENPNPPAWLIDYFSDLLRMFVVSGHGNHRDEVGQLADRLDCCEVTLAEALCAHSLAVEQLILGRRGRSAWHILGRANMIATELIMQRETKTQPPSAAKDGDTNRLA